MLAEKFPGESIILRKCDVIFGASLDAPPLSVRLNSSIRIVMS